MKCPFCGSDELKVIDKRQSDDESNRRRRECLSCGKRFTTYERVEMVDISVVKKDGRREQYDRNKILKGILKACEKRPISSERIQSTVDSIEAEIFGLETTEVPSTTVGDLIMKHLKELDEIAYIRFASVYRQFTDVSEFENELKNLQVVSDKQPTKGEPEVLVATPLKGSLNTWDRNRITQALVKEINIPEKDAEAIAITVEKKVVKSGLKTISVSFIRELVNNELLEKGFAKKLDMQEILGLSTFNLNQILFDAEPKTLTSRTPESVTFAIAESVMKQYALKEVFSDDVAEAHLKGVFHIHDLGYIMRFYNSIHSVEYIKKYGITFAGVSANPAKHAHSLTAQLNTFIANMQGYYSGALGLAYLNTFYAPLLSNLSPQQIEQEAQYLVFSCAQNAFSHGQPVFIDFNLHLDVPEVLKKTPAIGVGGMYMLEQHDGTIVESPDLPSIKDDDAKYKRVLTYADFAKQSQEFCEAIIRVWKDGDSKKQPFEYPRLCIHVSKQSFTDKRAVELLKLASSVPGVYYSIADTEEHIIACCRSRFIKKQPLLAQPESLRFCGFQNITINIPQAAYRGKTFDQTITEIKHAMDLACKAHLQKKIFISKILGKNKLLAQLGTKSPDGKPYVDAADAHYYIGLVGMKECLDALDIDSKESQKKGLAIVAAMYLKAQQLEKQYGIHIVLEESHSTIAAMRFALIDGDAHPESKQYIGKNKQYTGGVHNGEDDISTILKHQSMYDPVIEAGVVTNIDVTKLKKNELLDLLRDASQQIIMTESRDIQATEGNRD